MSKKSSTIVKKSLENMKKMKVDDGESMEDGGEDF